VIETTEVRVIHNLQMSLEASVARFSDMSLKQRSRSKSCRQTAAKELRPDDIVLSIVQTSFSQKAAHINNTHLRFHAARLSNSIYNILQQ